MTHIHPIHLLALLLLLTLTACNGNKTTDTAQSGGDAFPYPTIPNVLTEVNDRRDYLMLHFWDDYDFADTTLVLHNGDVTEQGLSNFLAMLNDAETPAATAQSALTAFCTALHGHAEAQQYFVDKCNDYLFDVNSPVYNEATFARFLQVMVADSLIDEVHRLRFAPVLELIDRNTPGSTATDFAFTTPDGAPHTLLTTPAVADRLLLLFYDPDCEHCREVLATMCDDPRLAAALMDHRLALLAVYTEGNEELWRNTLNRFPAGWQIGNDAATTVRSQFLYDLKAMPTLYLLDGNHTVLLKDASYDEVRRAFGDE
jgi:hypothetical protein